MKKGVISFIFIFSLILINVSAEVGVEKSANVLLTLKDINNYSDIDSVVVTINLNGNVINKFVEQGEILRISLKNGTYTAEFIVDDLSTDGKDYYNRETLIVENNLISGIFLYPVGSIRGIVKDKLENVISNAKLKFECPIDLISYPEITDKFGSFSLDYAPLKCKIFASYKESVGMVDVNIERGSLNDVEIKLDTSLVSDENSWLLPVLIFLIISIFAIIAISYKFRGRLKGSEAKTKKKDITADLKPKLRLGKRSKDILETLNNREKEIINFIVKSNGETTQAKIYYATGIPKVSLSRYIKSIEQKRVIEVKKIGKVNNIKLSEWFLEEDEGGVK